MKAQIAAMKRSGGGSIVDLSSTAGSRGMRGMAIYVTSKPAVEGLSRTAALERLDRGLSGQDHDGCDRWSK